VKYGVSLAQPPTSNPNPNTKANINTNTPITQWWALFFELFVLVAALVMTLLPTPKHLASARPILAHFFTMASVVVMVAANASMQTYVWCVRGARACAVRGGVGAGWLLPQLQPSTSNS